MEDIEWDVSGAEVIYTNIKPRPYNPLYRRKPNCKKMISALSIYLAVAAVGIFIFCRYTDLGWFPPLAAWSALYFCLIGKRAVIWLVRLYQYKAPDRVRLRCVFYPSCSEYMILAVEKYGTVRGVIRGIKRLQRCHSPNGGEDFP